ncbi:protein translocase subunit SecF [Patescibacteria group bacterium]|nr:protein translocase subunit SecF [Patescibacteria group bacterium]MDE1946769.1 protein translocase subunit SecF [Patescibacteria group bacterium]MDE2011098.1 protein translocase subunit SecF [Patescibacteria group bacterium]MDE2233595.1 protein translocase subunit SecF [Patescibacteria group bacterium]
MWVINNRKLFYAFSGTLVALSLLSLIFWGLNPGIDFTGGTLIDVAYSSGRPDQSAVTQALSPIDPTASVRPSGDNEFIIRMKALDENQHATVKKALTLNGSAQPMEKTYDSIGPVLGAEALRKAYVSIALVIIGIVLYITFAFRKVSEPVSSWKYGLVAIAALVHDVIIPTGAFSILGHFAGYEVDTLFVTALLVILGFSVHDTIVVFDRVRENLKYSSAKKPFSEVVGASISQTFTRSINTSATTLIALVVLYFVGGVSTEHFSLALIIGIAAGTYSSIFIGSPLLVTIERWQKK